MTEHSSGIKLRARAAVTLQFWCFATSASSDENRHEKVWDRHIHDKTKKEITWKKDYLLQNQ